MAIRIGHIDVTKWVNMKEINKSTEDMMTFGTGVLSIGIRSWYNPIRLIKGAIYQKRIHPLKIWKK